MKILLIGSHGYIGTRLYDSLSSLFDIDTVDLLWFSNNYRCENHLLQDFRTLTKNQLNQYETVILLAGHSSVKMCENNLSSAFYNNVANFLSLAQKLKPSTKFIYASSSSVYSGSGKTYVTEEHQEYCPKNYYDLTKSEIDNYARLIPNLQYYGLRFGTVNGYSRNLRNEIMINSMVSNAKKFNKISVNNPSVHRPILGMSDLCEAIKAIIIHGDMSKKGIYNLASFNSTVGEIAYGVSRLIHVPMFFGPDIDNVYDFSMSVKKMEDVFGFRFQESIKSITLDLYSQWDTAVLGDRNKPVVYEC